MKMQNVELGRKIELTGLGSAVSMDVARLADTRMLVQANSGAGKSWLLRVLCEQIAGQIPVIILDAEGEFASLRERVDLVLVGQDGEIPTDLRAAGLLARKLVELGVSAVVDLYDLKLPERRRFVRLFLESMMGLPRSLWHPLLVIIDEAHLFAPERSAGESEATDAIITLMSQGRKRGYAGILATQRLSKLHKDAAAEANNVFIGRTWLDVDQKRAGDLLGMITADRQGLRDLANGEFYAFGPALEQGRGGVVNFRSNRVQTTHPKAGERHLQKPPKASDAIRQIVSHLADLPAKAEEETKTLDDAKRKIRELERQLKQKPQPQADTQSIQRAVDQVHRDFKPIERSYQKIINELQGRLTKIISLADGPLPELQVLSNPREKTTLPSLADGVGIAIPAKPWVHHGEPVRQRTDGRLPIGEQKILTAAAQYPEGVTREQLSILTGYKRSSRDAYIQRLREKNYLTADLIATEDGLAALGDFEPLPTGEALQEYWLGRLPTGEKAIFGVAIEAYPESVSRDRLSDCTGYKRSSRDAYIQRLSARRIIQVVGRGEIKASEDLF